MLTVICLVWIAAIITTIKTVTARNDRTRDGKELLAFADSGAAVRLWIPKGFHRKG